MTSLLLARFTWNDAKTFVKTRDRIGKIFFGIFCVTYIVLWSMFKPADVPVFSFWLTIVFVPALLYCLHLRMFHFMFVAHWMYVLYYISTGTLYFMAMTAIHQKYTHYFIYEVGHLILANVIGLGLAMLVSVPFKLAQWFIYDTKIYYKLDMLMKLDERIYPEKMAKKAAEEKKKYQYDDLNETQLQAELKVAENEDRYEDAEKIRKILEKKFR